MSNSSAKRNGVGCLTVVGIVLLMLKLLAIEPVAGWSWIWVLCPFWIPSALAALFVFALAFAVKARGRKP